ncbi:MAG TPA: prenyltransferase/squalene oxidase repeat-containing protein [Pilimelia sp.]|nr:prenyltransferase/squalene oxidase repeat-containing protein [Pilimelia sp.]
MTGDQLTRHVDAAVEAAVEHLLSRRKQSGGWSDVLSASPMTTALALLATVRADPDTRAEDVRTSLAWLRAHQHPDGGWSVSDVHPPSSPGTTAIVAAVLQALDPEDSRDAVARAEEYVEAHGGDRVRAGRTGNGTRSWPAAVPIVRAAVGLAPVTAQPYQPVEVMLLPPRLRDPIGIGLPVVLPLGLLHAHTLPAGRLRRAAQRRAEPAALRWLRGVLHDNGGVSECPMISALMVLGLHGAGVGADLCRRSLEYLRASRRPDGSWSLVRDIEVSATAYAVLAMAEVGDAADGRLASTRRWLLDAQCGRFPPMRMPAGGWPSMLPSGWPDSEDTAMVLSCLGALGLTREHPAVDRGLRWLRSRQNMTGSWSLWIRDAPIVTDRPCPAVTAHAVMALRRYPPTPREQRSIRRALGYLRRAQRRDGSYHSSWFRTSTFGTAKALEAHAAVGRAGTAPAVRAGRWLLANQGADGGWSGGSGPATAEETAWALYALLAAGYPAGHAATVRAVRWLLDRQTAKGSWAPAPVGLFFDDLVYADDLVAHAFPLRALARWRVAAREAP